jgi:hypothetical protein
MRPPAFTGPLGFGSATVKLASLRNGMVSSSEKLYSLKQRYILIENDDVLYVEEACREPQARTRHEEEAVVAEEAGGKAAGDLRVIDAAVDIEIFVEGVIDQEGPHVYIARALRGGGVARTHARRSRAGHAVSTWKLAYIAAAVTVLVDMVVGAD